MTMKINTPVNFLGLLTHILICKKFFVDKLIKVQIHNTIVIHDNSLEIDTGKTNLT